MADRPDTSLKPREAGQEEAAMSPQAAKALVVVGMHRSGTSAMTRLLSLAGAELPEKIMLAGPDNPAGYWEPYEAVALNDELLGAVDSAWDDVFAFVGGPRIGKDSERAVSRAVKFLEESFRSGAPVIALKDPRSSVLAQVWDAALKAKGFDPVYVGMVRNPLEIAGSLGARDRFPTEKSTLLWLSYMLAAERDTRGSPRVFISYSDLLRDWRGVLKRVNQACGHVLPPCSAERAKEIDGFLAPDLRHHEIDTAALNAHPGVWDGVRTAYAWFEAAARGEEPSYAALDKVAERFAEFESVLGPVLVDMRRRTDRALRYRSLQDRSRDAQLEILKRELAVARDAKDRARYALSEVSQARDAAAKSLAEAEARANAMDAAFKLERQRRQHDHEAQVAHLSGLVFGLQNEIQALRSSTSWRLTAPVRAVSRLGARARSIGGGRLRRRIGEKRDIKEINASGLFDRAWYLSTYPDVAAAQVEPARHFLQSGWREGRHPGPKFDVGFYLWANPDVASAGINPLLHYIRFGRQEGRGLKPVGTWTLASEVDAPRPTLPLDSHRAPALARVVVVVHAFYQDVFDEICRALASLPSGFTFCVATPSEDARQAAQEAISRHGIDADVDLRVTPNRGRNFGSLIAEFGSTILEHDYVLHLHTKKSLYTDAEQRAWRESLYDALLGRRNLPSVFGLFCSRPDIGLVFAAPHRGLPYWANHWLQNTEPARKLFARLGLATCEPQGYVDYPVGGMFWARVSAIRPLFEAGLTYEDFPDEAGQTDGTLAHAIERGIAPLAKARGYEFAELDPDAQLFRLGWSHRNLHQYEAQSLTALKQAIDAAQVVSFDIFDTVLMRPSLFPDAVQRYVGHVLAERRPSSPDFFAERKAAEFRLREARDWRGDVKLSEIYAAFGPAWPQDLRAEAQQLERSLEAGLMCPRPPLLEALSYARAQGKRVVAVSDTYFDDDAIRAFLHRAGVPSDAFDAIYLSSDLGVRKDRGDIWPKLLELEEVSAGDWLHVGDNEVSDIQRPSDLGLRVFHVMTPSVLLQFKRFVSDPTTSDWRAAILLGPLTARLAANPFPASGLSEPVDVETAEDLGYCVFGPLVLAFTSWLLVEAQKKGVRHVYFLAREGWLLRRAYDRLREALGDASGPPGSYLHASRRAVLMARQAVQFQPGVILAGAGGFLGDFAGLARGRLGFEVAGEDGARPVALPRDADVAQGLLENHRDKILRQAEQELAAMRAYLAAEGIDRSSAVVDVGYSATIQRGLQAILGHGLHGFYMSVFQEAAEVAEQGGDARGFFLDQSEGVGTELISSVSLVLEAFLTAPHGQLERFDVDGDVTKPVHRPPGRDQAELDVLARMHDGALRFMDDALAFFGPEIVQLKPNPDAALEPLVALAAGRLRAPSDVLSSLKVDDAFSGKADHDVGTRLARA